MTFKGARAATFAFAAVQCHLDSDGSMALGYEVEAAYAEAPVGEKMLLAIDEPIIAEEGLLEFDDPTS